MQAAAQRHISPYAFSLNEGTLNVAGGAVDIRFVLREPPARGSRGAGQAAAMGGWSARNYAIAAGVQDAQQHTWEWLHLLGAALGGTNVEGKLVAGTYDSNTQMNTVETAIGEFCAEVLEKSPMDVDDDSDDGNDMDTYETSDIEPVIVHINADLWTPPGQVFAWYIARTITVDVFYNKQTKIHAEFAGTEAARYSQLEYDLHNWLASQLPGPHEAADADDEASQDAEADDGW